MIPQLYHTHINLDEEQARRLRNPLGNYHTVQVKPPRNGANPETLERFIRGIQELQSKWLGLKNASPRAAFEIRRTATEQLRFQFAVPSKRLDRKVRTHLTTELPGAELDTGSSGVSATAGTSVGGALLTTGRADWYPLRTEYDSPPNNSVAAALHRHAMQDTRFVIQVLFQPVSGKPVRRKWWQRRAYKRIGYLRKEKEKLWGSRSATPRERSQADAIERKAGTNRFKTSIRILVIGAGEYTQTRVKEIAGGFNIYDNLETGQYLDTVTVKSLRTSPIYSFCRAVTDRKFGAWSRKFQTSVPELAGLVSIPDSQQQNIRHAQQ